MEAVQNVPVDFEYPFEGSRTAVDEKRFAAFNEFGKLMRHAC